MKPTLSSADFIKAAKLLGCDVAAIKAICEVEAPKGGFNPDDTPTTLFEGHQFHKYTKGRFGVSHPTLSFPKWDRKFYGKTWQEEQARLRIALTLDRTAALMSASWGKFQVMGFNSALVGFTSVEDFYNAMCESEGAQLGAFCQYVIHNYLKDELQRKDWAGFAKGYNGVEYFKNSYDKKLAAAYLKHSKG